MTEGLTHGFVAGRYAAIDIGTVTCRMLVADVDAAGAIHEVDREYAITNLGEGVDAAGVLAPAAISRTVETVGGYCAVRDRLTEQGAPIVKTVAVATSASRDAENSDEFVQRLAKLGVVLSVIPGSKEAGLSFSGASCDFPGQDLMVVDIGGGSTEMVVGRAGQAPAWAHSFDIGCRRVTEKFIRTDPPASDELDRAREWVSQQLARRLGEAGKAGITPERLVAVAGTATTVVAVRDQMRVYDSTKVHKALVTRQQLDRQYAELAAMPLEQRSQVVGLDPGRAPVIVAGLVIMQAVMDAVGVDGFTVSETDILHGIILDAAKRG
ncbi:Ppx/GppA phosphatase family protein [uncultured Senegalimassilia sp.]|uniref:Ppx/GppA phosphatase family protein n=1 Tax=uncultured Senegalimassilia sp. TaxID=1714350 RepID=UPI0025CC6EF4|nr:Ppx/GppA phosphatase family protein [uncultured Senegalimassilia sp.]